MLQWGVFGLVGRLAPVGSLWSGGEILLFEETCSKGPRVQGSQVKGHLRVAKLFLPKAEQF